MDYEANDTVEDADEDEEAYHRGLPTVDASVEMVEEEEEEEGEPYFNPDDYVPVSPKLYQAPPDLPEEELSIPDPPPIEDAIPQDPALLHPASSQEALQRALNAWYTAGYAAAVYHMKSGMMPGS